MGSAVTQILMYGVEIDYHQAAHFLAQLKSDLVATGSKISKMSDHDLVSKDCKQYLALEGLFLRGCGANGEREDNCEWYDPKQLSSSYILGFDIGANGYGHSDDLHALSKKPVKANIQNQWTNIIAPILKKAGIKQKVALRSCTQIH